jgi:hypothetical protein
MKVGISLYLDYELLVNVESDIKGKNRSEKIEKCIVEGYKVLLSIHPPMERAVNPA